MTNTGRIAKVVLALFPSFLSLAQNTGEKEQRLWLFANLLSDLQTADRSACEDGCCKHLVVCSASDRSQGSRMSSLRERWLPTFGNEVTESCWSDF